MLRLRDTDQEIAGALDSEHVRQPFQMFLSKSSYTNVPVKE